MVSKEVTDVLHKRGGAKARTAFSKELGKLSGFLTLLRMLPSQRCSLIRVYVYLTKYLCTHGCKGI